MRRYITKNTPKENLKNFLEENLAPDFLREDRETLLNADGVIAVYCQVLGVNDSENLLGFSVYSIQNKRADIFATESDFDLRNDPENSEALTNDEIWYSSARLVKETVNYMNGVLDEPITEKNLDIFFWTSDFVRKVEEPELA